MAVVPLEGKKTPNRVPTEQAGVVPSGLIEFSPPETPEPFQHPQTEEQTTLSGIGRVINCGWDLLRGVDGLINRSESRREFARRTSTETAKPSNGKEFAYTFTEGTGGEDRPAYELMLPFSTDAGYGIGIEFAYHFHRHFPEADVAVYGNERSDQLTFAEMALSRLELQGQLFGKRPVRSAGISEGGAIQDLMLKAQRNFRVLREQDDDSQQSGELSQPRFERAVNYVGAGMHKISPWEAVVDIGLGTAVDTIRRLPTTPPLHLPRHLHTLVTTARWPHRGLYPQARQNMDGTSIGIGPHLPDDIPMNHIGGSRDKAFYWGEHFRLMVTYLEKPISLTVLDGLTHAAATRARKAIGFTIAAMENGTITPYAAREEESLTNVPKLVDYLRDTGRLHYLDPQGQEMSNADVISKVEAALAA